MEILFKIALAADEATIAGNPGQTLETFPKLDAWVSETFPLLIQIISAIAVLAIAYWGIRYILSGIPGIKSYGKERMWSAILGLLLALAAYLILKTINPDILSAVNNFLK